MTDSDDPGADRDVVDAADRCGIDIGSRSDDEAVVYGASAPEGYVLCATTPTVDEFQALREAAGMTRRGREAVERGLPNTTYGVHVRTDVTNSEADSDRVDCGPASGEAVGMARIVGDAGSVFHISDMAVAAEHQHRGVGTAMMDALAGYLTEEAPEGAYVNLLADVDGFYDQWGFEYSAPASKGMSLRTE